MTADAVRCRNIDLYDKQLYNMFASPVRGVYPDLTFPAHNDGWYGESLIAQAGLFEAAYARFRDRFSATCWPSAIVMWSGAAVMRC